MIYYGVFNIEVRNQEYVCFHMETTASSYEKARNNFVYRIKQEYPKYRLQEIYSALPEKDLFKTFAIIPFTKSDFEKFRKTFK